jgi:hypothetical protein
VGRANRDAESWIEAFQIFAKYVPEDEYFEVAAEHDEIYAGPNPEKVTPEDKARLEELGWHDFEDGCFKKFV